MRISTTSSDRSPAFLALALAYVCGFAAGCGEAGEGADGAVVRDSAGITIVEHEGLPSEAMGPWTIGALELEIGQQDGAPEYAFAFVVDARQLPDGRVVVAEGNDRTLRVFASDGTHQSTFGGEGGGPGEFGQLDGIAWLDSDEVWGWDSRNQRLTRFTLGGELVATNTLEAEAYDRASELYRLPGGGYVARSTWRDPTDEMALYDMKLKVDSMVARHVADDGSLVDTIAVLAASEALEAISSPEEGVFRTRRARRIASRQGYFAHTPEGVVTGWSGAYELARWSSVIERELLIRVAHEPIAWGNREKEDIYRAFLISAGVAPEDVDLSTMLEGIIPDFAPAFSAVIGAETGEVWVADYAIPGESVEWWTVFSLEGQIAGRLQLPPDFRVHQIGQDYVLGVGRDELDVPYVRRYALQRSTP